jgi:hypothetical protein
LKALKRTHGKVPMKMLLIALALPALLVSFALQDAEMSAEQKAVEAAVLDYVEGIYDVDPERIERSVHKDLKKYGFWRKDAETPYQGKPMTYDQLHALAGEYNPDKHIPADAPKQIEVLDLMDQTATAKLTAEWGVDSMQLAKFNGKWQILHVLWQSHPPGTH